MKNEYLQQFNFFGESALESTKELLKINTELMSKLLENQVSLAKILVESSEIQLGSAQSITEPKDFVAKQTAFLEECGVKLSAAAQANTEVTQKAGQDFKAWFEKGMTAANESISESVKQSVAPVAEVKPLKKAVAKTPAAKKPAVKKTAAKKPATTTTKKAAAPAPEAKKPAAKPAVKATASKTKAPSAAKKAPVKKAPVKKPTAKKTPVKAAAKKS